MSYNLPPQPEPPFNPQPGAASSAPALPNSVRYAAYISFAQAALLLISACIIITVVGQTDFTQFNGRGGGLIALLLVALSALAYCVAPIFILLFALLGVGLLRRWGWAWWGTIIVAGLDAVLAFPLGTLFSVPIIILLLRPEARQVFQRTPPLSA